MNDILLNLLCFIISYLLVFTLYVFLNKNKKTYSDGSKQIEVNYLVNKFNLDKRKTKYNTIKWFINILNPLIISITFLLVTNINSIIIAVIVGFGVMMLLVDSIYELLGRYLKKKESDYDV